MSMGCIAYVARGLPRTSSLLFALGADDLDPVASDRHARLDPRRRRPPPSEVVGPNHEEVPRHPDRVLDDVEFAAGHFLPPDADFAERDAGPFGEEEELAVEDPAGGVQGRVQELGGRAGLEFEAALGVADGGEAKEGEVQVEAAHEEVAQCGALERVSVSAWVCLAVSAGGPSP